jgi:hypothetical protein
MVETRSQLDLVPEEHFCMLFVPPFPKKPGLDNRSLTLRGVRFSPWAYSPLSQEFELDASPIPSGDIVTKIDQLLQEISSGLKLR